MSCPPNAWEDFSATAPSQSPDDLEDTPVESEVVVLPCKAHFFHEECISQWITKQNACPICRQEINTPEVLRLVMLMRLPMMLNSPSRNASEFLPSTTSTKRTLPELHSAQQFSIHTWTWTPSLRTKSNGIISN